MAAAWLIKAVITARLKANADTEIERIKNELARDVEAFKIRLKADTDAEIERLRHFLSSRISKIHEKEFEVLPKAWLMLNDLHGSVALALDLTFKTYPDFRALRDAEFEEFLATRPASRLSATQKDGLRRRQEATDRQKYFIEAMAGVYLDDANEKQRIFHNYLIEHRIFMTDALREKFGAADQALSKALISYSLGKRAKNWEMTQSGQEEMGLLKDLVDKVEQAVQERLQYEEA
jgi:hypothetical protein